MLIWTALPFIDWTNSADSKCDLRNKKSVFKKQKKRHQLIVNISFSRAEDGAQTRDPQLGRLMLYQLSYFRILIIRNLKVKSRNQFLLISLISNFRKWAVKDSNLRSRKTAELQSAPVGHFGNCPVFGNV